MSADEPPVEETSAARPPGLESAGEDGGSHSALLSDEPEGNGRGSPVESVPLDPARAYRQALDHYLAGRLRRAVEIVDAVLSRDVETELRPRLERLLRRAEDRIGKESGIFKLRPLDDSSDAAPLFKQESVVEPLPPSRGDAPLFKNDRSDDPGGRDAEPGNGGPGEEPPAGTSYEAIEEGETTALMAQIAAGDPVELEPPDRLTLAEEGSEDGPVFDAAPAEAPANVEEEPAADERSPAEIDDALSVALEDEPAAPAAEPGMAEAGEPPLAQAGEPASPPAESGPVVARTAPTPARPPARPAGPGRRRPSGPPRRGAAGPPAPPARIDMERVQVMVDGLTRTMRGVQGHMLQVAEAYQRLSHSHKRKEQAYDQLYEELRQYKDNFLLQAQKPLFMDLILLYDAFARTLRTLENQDGESLPREAAVRVVRNLLDELLEILYRRDIEPIREEAEVLDVAYQKPVQRIDTDDPSEDRAVAQVVRDGFRMNGAVLRPQEVVVKRCLKERETQ